MIYHLLADSVILMHFAFILFVVFGGILCLRWRKLLWVHAPAVIWGAAVEWAGWICPLTPLENWFLVRAGSTSYSGGFVEQYIMPIIYPIQLTRQTQILLALSVILLNVLIYVVIFFMRRPETLALKP
jgi:Protein of Unknown function (DUF2784)